MCKLYRKFYGHRYIHEDMVHHSALGSMRHFLSNYRKKHELLIGTNFYTAILYKHDDLFYTLIDHVKDTCTNPKTYNHKK